MQSAVSHAQIVEGMYQHQFVTALVKFVDSDEVQDHFQNFFLKYCMEFERTDEQPLKYYDYFLEYRSIFEHYLESFCENEGLTASQLVYHAALHTLYIHTIPAIYC